MTETEIVRMLMSEGLDAAAAARAAVVVMSGGSVRDALDAVEDPRYARRRPLLDPLDLVKRVKVDAARKIEA